MVGKHDRDVRQNSGHLVHECGIESDKDAFFSSSVELPTYKLKVNRESGFISVGVLLLECKDRVNRGGLIRKDRGL